MIVYLRNAHPKQTVYLPIARGLCRVLRPAVTTAVPARLLRTPVVRQLLLRKMLEVADGSAWDPDVRQRRSSRIDMARAITAAEQAEFDRLRRYRQKPTASRGWTRWTPELEARLLADGTNLAALATELDVTRRTVLDRREALRRSGPRQPHERKRRADEWPVEHIKRLREDLAAGLTIAAVAAALGRTAGATGTMARRLGLERHDGRRRPATPAPPGPVTARDAA
jgi:hypothetical protein